MNNPKIIANFREALVKGEVPFTFIKKDGTVRKARGTLCDACMPAENLHSKKKFKCTDIEWDMPEEDEFDGLPNEVIVELDSDVVDDLIEEELEDELCDALTDTYDVCVKTFKYEQVKRKFAKDTILYWDLDKKNFRSLKESQLVDYTDAYDFTWKADSDII